MTSHNASDLPLGADMPQNERAASLKSDFSALTKPRITLMVVLTTLVGYVVAAPVFKLTVLLHTLLGTALLSTSSAIFNQWLERRTDAAMRRTADRPLASGRMRPGMAVVLGTAFGLAGTAQLWWMVNPLTAAVGLATLVLYVWVYTPLKRHSSLSTLVGAVPGAMPPMMGCTAATGELGALAWALFGILFLWQMPHFLAIAWMYKADYERGGFPMLTVGDYGQRTARQMVLYAGALLPVSVVPAVLGFSGIAYFIGALLFGLGFLWYSFEFGRNRSAQSARRVLLASVLYLPAVLLLMVVDRTAL
ncbi:MAG: heme o synthase [Acidobacteriota bacterium]